MPNFSPIVIPPLLWSPIRGRHTQKLAHRPPWSPAIAARLTPPRPQRDGALEVTFEYGDDGILTVQITDPHAGHKKRFAIQQTGPDQMDAGQIMKMKRINEDLMKRGQDLEESQEYK